MKIEYLAKLQDNPYENPSDLKNSFIIEGITLNEIQDLEKLYNNGNPFPKVLKELLFLAGNYCYVCDYGIDETQQELQEWVREDMADNGRTISRPFYAFDVYGGDQFLFIYLDEGENPTVYEAHPWITGSNWIKHLDNLTIKSLVDSGIERVKRGENPF
ncbi:SMI1/KNR4 family protein [Flavobacterium geliluteum]|uniref:SMI1/KNR4 family protein n=1 Tax=Flavobacterium geliluteum TaxID=2816120 RepID=A0A940X6K2_9FLAO|nr:SMI1/KNR4 family protein [Flavobacterium geliluteum]MBP4136950.1 SMI1/KNR4 family protein [Flavobacterium geliluteum]